MLYTIENIEDLENSEKLASYKKQVEDLRLKDKKRK